jgi:hypothetical protein
MAFLVDVHFLYNWLRKQQRLEEKPMTLREIHDTIEGIRNSLDCLQDALHNTPEKDLRSELKKLCPGEVLVWNGYKIKNCRGYPPGTMVIEDPDDIIGPGTFHGVQSAIDHLSCKEREEEQAREGGK